MSQNGCSGCTNPQIFGTLPFAPADFEASSTMCTCCFENQKSQGCTCTRRSKFLTHSLKEILVFQRASLIIGNSKTQQCSVLSIFNFSDLSSQNTSNFQFLTILNLTILAILAASIVWIFRSKIHILLGQNLKISTIVHTLHCE